MTEVLMQLIRISAIGPESNGEGELRKAEMLSKILNEVGFDKLERHDANDSRVPSGKRPNLVAYLNGEDRDKRLWIVTHTDVVPSGEETMWKITRPFEPTVKNNCVYGRGSEDNGQSLVASIFAAKALKRLNIKPKRTLALAFVADEEQGSTMGIQHLIKKGIFRKNDLIVVPDSGNENGSFIEIAEKSILWFKLTTIGKQTHGSLPQKGLNAHRVGMQAALELDSMLHEKYKERNDYFNPPTSTFEPTRKDKNVDAVNIVPGEDVVYFDCRLLPQYDIEEALIEIKRVVSKIEKKTGAKINIEILQKQSAPPLIENNPEIVELLKEAIKKARGIEATTGGIGGEPAPLSFEKQEFPQLFGALLTKSPINQMSIQK